MCGEMSYQQFLKGLMAEHGAFAVVALAFGLVLWRFLLVPMADTQEAAMADRKIFVAILTETAKQNAHHIEEMNHSSRITKEAMISMQTAVELFTADMWRTHPEQTQKLDLILNKLEKMK